APPAWCACARVCARAPQPPHSTEKKNSTLGRPPGTATWFPSIVRAGNAAGAEPVPGFTPTGADAVGWFDAEKAEYATAATPSTATTARTMNRARRRLRRAAPVTGWGIGYGSSLGFVKVRQWGDAYAGRWGTPVSGLPRVVVPDWRAVRKLRRTAIPPVAARKVPAGSAAQRV